MLSSVRIRNFRTCKDVRLTGLDKTPVVALVGRNASGKTNILQAIEWAAWMASSETFPSVELNLYPKNEPQQISVELHFSLNNISYIYHITTSSIMVAELGELSAGPLIRERLLTYRDGRRVKILAREGNDLRVYPEVRAVSPHSDPRKKHLVLPLRTPAIPYVNSVPNVAKPIVKELGSIQDFLQSVRYYPLEELNTSAADSFITEEAYTAWESRRRRREWVRELVEMKILSLARTDQERFRVLTHVLGPSGLALLENIRIDTIKRQNNGKTATYWLGFEQQTSEGPLLFDFRHLSQGTRRVVRIVVSLLSDSNSVMLLEHPEDSVHSDLLVNLLATLRAYAPPGQIILTTHSPFVLNVIEPEEVRLVELKKAITRVRPLSAKELRIATEYTKEEGALSDFLEVVQSE